MGDNLCVTVDSDSEIEGNFVETEMTLQQEGEGCDKNRTADHSYSGHQSESDIMGWYCLGVA